MEQLLSYFLANGIPAAEVSKIGDAFKHKKFPKGSYFAEEGKTSKHLAFITKGLFQYYYSKDGKEITTYITGENTFLASLWSFYRQKPSKEYIRALTDGEVWMIHYNDLAKLKSESEAFKSFYIDGLESVIVGIDESRANLITLTAEERYAELMKNEPELLQQIPLQYLAFYFGRYSETFK